MRLFHMTYYAREVPYYLRSSSGYPRGAVAPTPQAKCSSILRPVLELALPSQSTLPCGDMVGLPKVIPSCIDDKESDLMMSCFVGIFLDMAHNDCSRQNVTTVVYIREKLNKLQF